MIALAQGERAHTRARTKRSHTAHLPRRAPSRDPRSTQRTRGSLAAPLLFFLFAVSGPPGFAFLGARGGVRTRRRVVLEAFRAYENGSKSQRADNRALGCARVVYHGDGAPGATLTAPGRRNLLK